MTSPLRRIVSGIVILGLKVFTIVTKRPRARVLVINEHGQILLIRAHISHGKWTLPGGGLNRNERPVAAARRELYEETGIDADEHRFDYLATLEKPEHDIPFPAPLFRITVQEQDLPKKLFNPHEIESIGWFDRDTLPAPLSATVTAAVKYDQRH